ncbi:hypothetical protein HDU76_006819 [Blyttiomyces sp. JEL0837]|nr:hypothetical protein HDU76_006819 [Blyttiomyces sp. JEL0837]
MYMDETAVVGYYIKGTPRECAICLKSHWVPLRVHQQDDTSLVHSDKALDTHLTESNIKLEDRANIKDSNEFVPFPNVEPEPIDALLRPPSGAGFDNQNSEEQNGIRVHNNALQTKYISDMTLFNIKDTCNCNGKTTYLKEKEDCDKWHKTPIAITNTLKELFGYDADRQARLHDGFVKCELPYHYIIGIAEYFGKNTETGREAVNFGPSLRT